MAQWNYDIFWKETLNQIKSELEEQEFLMWFNLEYTGAAENKITLGVPSSFYRDQVVQRYQSYIENKLTELIGRKIAVVFEVKPVNRGEKARIQPGTAKIKVQEAAKPEKKLRHFQLREDYSFDKYIIGENNNFAAASAQAIARNPGTAYNPFFIYGGVGLGKTHLMQAIGNYIHENSTQRVIYITAEDFTNEFIQSIKDKSQPSFKSKYRYNVDVLLIDDVHFLQKKWETQEELFYTFNALYDANKQMAFTCDRPVSELKDFNDRLQSRVGRGLNVDLQPPDYETRCAICKKKTETSGLTIPDEVIALICRNISSNIRDLESALNTLTAFTRLVGQPVTVEVAQQRLKDVFASSKQINMSLETIQRVTADYFSLTLADLKGKKRTTNIVLARHLAMFVAREITEFSTTDIGQAFGGRDHATVMHACQKIEERLKIDPALATNIENLKRSIKESSAKS
jgi:chromosomal replication initiator protein